MSYQFISGYFPSPFYSIFSVLVFVPLLFAFYSLFHYAHFDISHQLVRVCFVVLCDIPSLSLSLTLFLLVSSLVLFIFCVRRLSFFLLLLSLYLFRFGMSLSCLVLLFRFFRAYGTCFIWNFWIFVL